MNPMDKNAVCRGSWSMGNACGACKKCVSTMKERNERLVKVMLHVAGHTQDKWSRDYITTRLDDLGYDAKLKSPVNTKDSRIEMSVGNVLDHWEQLPNDIRLDPGFENMDSALEDLRRTVEDKIEHD